MSDNDKLKEHTDLLKRARNFLSQMAPHQKARLQGKLFIELVSALTDYEKAQVDKVVKQRANLEIDYPQSSKQPQEWTPEDVEKLWRSHGGWALTSNPYSAISKAINAALATERAKVQFLESVAKQRIEALNRTTEQLLAARAAIEEVKKAGYRLFGEDGTNVLESVDLSLLHQHDQEVCKPLVELIRKCRRHLGYTIFLKHEIDAALSKFKESNAATVEGK